jgi:hypothetical protein
LGSFSTSHERKASQNRQPNVEQWQ